MRKNKRTDRNPRGAGQKRKCFCDRWGCLLCMQRFIREAYSIRREERIAKVEEEKVNKNLIAIQSPNGKYKIYLPNEDREPGRRWS